MSVASKESSRQLRLCAFAGAGLLGLGVLTAVISCVKPIAPTPLIAYWSDCPHAVAVTENLAANNDRRAIDGSSRFEVHHIEMTPGRDDGAKAISASAPRVIYVRSAATRGADGAVLLLSDEFSPTNASEGTPLDSLLDRVDAIPAAKLLVLDLSWSHVDGLAGLLPCDAGAAVHEREQSRALQNCLTLVSCTEEQSPTLIEGTQRTAFGYFFEAGVRGCADGCSDTGVTDGRVTAQELADYVSDRVARWSQLHASAPQTPKQYASGFSDFILAAAKHDAFTTESPNELEPYPEWLLEAWRRVEGWRVTDVERAVPRLVKRFEAELIKAELHWRWSQESSYSPHWETASHSILQEIESAQTRLAATPIISIAQLNSSADPALVEAWLSLFDAPEKEAATAAFEAAVSEATYEQLAQAAMQAIADSGELIGAAIACASEKLAHRSSSPRLLEVADLGLLSEVIENRPELDDATLAEFWRVTLLRSEIAVDSDLPKVLIDKAVAANQRRQSAFAALVSPGYASLDDARHFNTEAMRCYQAILSRRAMLERARSIANQALSTLPAMAPLMRVNLNSGNDHLAAVGETDRLLTMLEASSDKDDEVIDAAAGRLERLLARLTEVANPESVNLLSEEVRRGDVQRSAVAEALLVTPLLKADDRAKLVTALRERALEANASLLTLATEAHGAASRLPLPGNRDVAFLDAIGLIRWEAEATCAILQLAGFSTKEIPVHFDGERLSQIASLRSLISTAYETDIEHWSPERQRRASNVLPPHSYHPMLDKHDATPTLIGMLKRRGFWANRFAARVFNAAKDLHDPTPYLDLARQLDPTVATSPCWVRVNGATDGVPVTVPELSMQSPSATLAVHVDHAVGETPKVDVLQPAECLDIKQEVRAVSSGSEVRLRLDLRQDATIVQQLATHGVLLRVKVGDAVAHRRIATPGVAAVSPVEVLIEVAGIRTPWSEKLSLPPTMQPSTMRLIAVNHSDREMTLQAEVMLGEALRAEAVVDAGAEAVFKLSPINAAAPPSDNPISVSSMALTLREGDRELLSGVAKLGVVDPAAYLLVRDARYVQEPSAGPRLRFVVERLASAPTLMKVLWAPSGDDNTSDPFQVKDGTLAATLTPQSPVSTMEAALVGRIGGSEALRAVATVNGVAGALKYVSQGPIGQQSMALTRSTEPDLELVAPTMVASGERLAYSLEALSSEAGVTLEATLVPANAGYEASPTSAIVQKFNTSRRQLVSVATPKEPGDLMVASTLGAWTGAFDTTGLSGHWRIDAVAIDKEGVVVARRSADVVIDGDSPNFLEVSPVTPLVAGKPATFRIDAKDTLSGVASVRAYLGEPLHDAPPPDAKPAPAAPLAGQFDAWSVILPLPQASTATATFEVTDRVGKVRRLTQQLVLIDESAASLGSVAGTVVEGVLPQPNLTVELRDPQQQPVAASKTDAKGAFHFAGVKPGKYLVWSVKAASQRVDAAAVEVQPGAESKVDLKLAL